MCEATLPQKKNSLEGIILYKQFSEKNKQWFLLLLIYLILIYVF